MGDFFVYILKSSVCLATFYLFYRLLLSRETFHRFNRIALLSVIVLSVTVPFIHIMTEEPVALQRPMQNLEYLLQMAQRQTVVEVQATQSLWLPLLFVLYLAGCLFFSCRFLYSTLWIYRTIRRGKSELLSNGKKLVITTENISPFSWMGYIVISERDMKESSEEILAHEMAHIYARHSLDMLICSTCVVLQWFNPAVWLLKQELQNIHEYEADEHVIRHGVEAKKYQLLLIKKAVGSQRFTSMANSFNHSKLKKRITMMLKQKSSPWARLKYLYVLPLTSVAVVAFARPEISRELEKISSAKISEIVPVKEVVVPKKVEPAVAVASVAPVREKKPIVKKAMETEVRMQKVKKKVEMSRYLILIDNEVATYEQMDNVAPENIHSYSISPKEKCLDVLTKHNASDKLGLISIVTKVAITSGKIKENDVMVVGYGPMEDLLAGEVKVKVRGVKVGKEKPLVIIDGVEQSEKDSLDELDPNLIESISVLKDSSAVNIYGVKGKDGVILVTTKKRKE